MSKDKSVCFRKRPSFINETIHYEELGDEYLYNAKKRKRDEFEQNNRKKKFTEDEEGEDSEDSTASNAGKVSTQTIAVH